MRAVSSNGSLTTITSYAALTSLTPAVSVEREESPRADGAAAAPWIVSATAAANATLSATFHSRIGTRFLSVLDEGVGVDAVNYKLAGAAAANRFSFVALAGSARRSKVEVRFADGTAFADIADADWIAPGALVQFSTTDPAAIDINSSSGVATLLECTHPRHVERGISLRRPSLGLGECRGQPAARPGRCGPRE